MKKMSQSTALGQNLKGYNLTLPFVSKSNLNLETNGISIQDTMSYIRRDQEKDIKKRSTTKFELVNDAAAEMSVDLGLARGEDTCATVSAFRVQKNNLKNGQTCQRN